MEVLGALLDIAKSLLSDEEERKPELVLRHVLQNTGAERAYLVIREGNGLVRRFEVRWSESHFDWEDSQFDSEDLDTPSDDLEFEPTLIDGAPTSSVMAVALMHEEVQYGLLYLEHLHQGEVFGDSTRLFLEKLADLANPFFRRALEREALRQRARQLAQVVFQQHDFSAIVTGHPAMLRLLRTVSEIAGSGTPVLLRGEPGTGKELIARALHRNSPWKDQPFVAIPCDLMSEEALDVELFGRKGTFEQGQTARPGAIETAEGGIVFLDTISEMSLALQAKLMRFLETGEVQRVGSDWSRRVQARIVAASHEDLREAVRGRRFRADLYERLRVVELQVPPLRERVGDVALLSAHFLAQEWKKEGKPAWSPEALSILEGYEYPGNVRELQYQIERACLLAKGLVLGVDLLPPELVPLHRRDEGEPRPLTAAALKSDLEAAKDNVERRFLADLMSRWDWNVSKAAQESGLSGSHLQRLLTRHRNRLAQPGDPEAAAAKVDSAVAETVEPSNEIEWG